MQQPNQNKSSSYLQLAAASADHLATSLHLFVAGEFGVYALSYPLGRYSRAYEFSFPMKILYQTTFTQNTFDAQTHLGCFPSEVALLFRFGRFFAPEQRV